MEKERLAAFSDGVIAIIITIMVLELKVPQGSEWGDGIAFLPQLLSYILSFIYVAIASSMSPFIGITIITSFIPSSMLMGPCFGPTCIYCSGCRSSLLPPNGCGTIRRRPPLSLSTASFY